ncbi:MAG: hypothetical protein RL514_2485 [Verrucomicrobiota bacterium]|jgi:peptidoglycan-associated lipoprotein
MGTLKIFTSSKQIMKRSLFLKLATVALLAVVTVTGCKTKGPKNVTPIPGARTGVAPAAAEVTTPGGQNPGGLNPGGLNPGGVGTVPTRVNPEAITTPPLFPPPVTGDPKDNGLPPVEMKGDRIVDRASFAASAIHFDYDKAIVKASELGKLQPVIAALKGNPQNNLEVEGHCDERGTEEYNRALGERRALAIRAQLIKSGIAPARISTTSFGEDKPAALGHDDAAWAKNRRGELVLLKPKN